RNSSLLSLGAAGEAAPACSGAAAALVTLAEVFAVAAAGRPGLRVGAAGFLVSVALTRRAMSLGSFHRSRNLACQPALRVIPLACKRQPARASFTCFAGLKPSLRDAAISIVSPELGLRPWRAGLSFTLNFPMPGRLTSSPFFAASTMPANTASTAFLAALFSTP